MIKELENKIKKKEEEIIHLKISNLNKEKKYSKNDFISVNFLHSNYNYSVICLKTDVFAKAEEELYQEYRELRETNNIFLYNGSQVLRFKTIEENKIKTWYPVLLQLPD